MKNLLQDHRGIGLALVIILTAYIFVMGCAALALAVSSQRNAGIEVCRHKAYYTAEVGIEQALSIIRSGRLDLSVVDSGLTVDLVPEYIPVDCADGQIGYVKVSRTGVGEEQFTIYLESMGTYQQARCILKVEAEVCPAAEPSSIYMIKVLSWKVNT